MITRKLPVGRIADIPPGTTKSFRFGVSDGIAYNDDGVLKAYVNRCTHMGGMVVLKKGPGSGCEGCVFRCVRHFAEFDPSSGERLSGEAPEGTALMPIELVIEGEEVFAKLELKEDFE
jgi:nitrite reductase/ring-hydroxylating ferredoxin subunit